MERKKDADMDIQKLRKKVLIIKLERGDAL